MTVTTSVQLKDVPFGGTVSGDGFAYARVGPNVPTGTIPAGKVWLARLNDGHLQEFDETLSMEAQKYDAVAATA